MVFSAGTFLYVATIHVLPEVINVGHSHDPSGGSDKPSGFCKSELFILFLGAILSLFLTNSYHHFYKSQINCQAQLLMLKLEIQILDIDLIIVADK